MTSSSRRTATVAAVDTPLLAIHEASVMRGGKLVLDRLSMRVANGQHTAILGPNGSGKSTLVQLIARQLYPLAREDDIDCVRIFGRARWSVEGLHHLLGMVSPALQSDYTGNMPLGVFDAVVSGFFSARGLGRDQQPSEQMREQAHQALRQMDAIYLHDRPMASLSTGEARRVLIARALVHQPRALLLDEPCAGLDMASRRHFLEILRQLARAGTTLVLVTHHVEELLPEIEQVVLLRDGRVLRAGHKRDVLTAPWLSAAFGMPIQVEQHGDYYATRLA